MLKDLFVNACIFIAVFFIGNQVMERKIYDDLPSLRYRVISGIINGFLGIILMVFSIRITSNAIMDLRHLSLIVGGIYLGGTATLITGVILALFRIFSNGVSNTSITVGIMIMVASIGSASINKINIREKFKWIALFFYTTIVFSISITLAVGEYTDIKTILVYFWIGSIISNVISYYYIKYLRESNNLIRMLKEEATKDFLTGLNNTRSFDVLFNNIVNDVKENNKKLSMLAIDIDFFKRINDNYGHASGDEVLRELSLVLEKSIRAFDIVARVGGEEFSILLKDCDRQQAYETGERIRKAVENHAFDLFEGNRINITISIGIGTYPETVEDISQIKEYADSKLYMAKRSGRNRVCA